MSEALNSIGAMLAAGMLGGFGAYVGWNIGMKFDRAVERLGERIGTYLARRTDGGDT